MTQKEFLIRLNEIVELADSDGWCKEQIIDMLKEFVAEFEDI